MDPNETLEALMRALARRDSDEAKEYAESLNEWLSKGGFPPALDEEYSITILLLLTRAIALGLEINR